MTHDFNAALREIPALLYGAMLALAHGGPAEEMVQDEADACAVAIGRAHAGLVHGVRDAHVGGRVERRVAHGLEIGRVHRVGSMKGRGRGLEREGEKGQRQRRRRKGRGRGRE